MKPSILKKTCTRIFSATSFGQKREITKYPSIGKTDNKHKIHRGKTKKKLTKTPNCREYFYNGTLLGNKKERTTDTCDVNDK